MRRLFADIEFTRRRSLALMGGAFLMAACQPSGARSSGESVGQDLADPVARAFYARRGGQAAWDPEKTQTLNAVIAGAKAHGLDPQAFVPKPAPGAGADETLTLAALAYAKALALGFVDPHKIEAIFTLEPNQVDLGAGLADALDGNRLAAWFESLAPGDAEYKALSTAYLAALAPTGLASAPTDGAPVGQSMAPADQARQLAANLERRRWLARTPPAHRIDVNTAGAFLGYVKPGQPDQSILAVVGRDDHATPSIQAAFHRLVANPPWRVPMDIARKEILPKGAGYMARQHMRIVDGLVEQAAGPKSALGLVKFDVEDPYDIYLHDTPSKAAFAAPDRHRSHGCVRVQHAVAFARSIAAETGQGTAFDQALADGKTHMVDLGQSVSVRMLYHTAYLGPGGQVLLAPDVYGSDDRLAAALGLGQAAAAARPTEPAVLFGP